MHEYELDTLVLASPLASGPFTRARKIAFRPSASSCSHDVSADELYTAGIELIQVRVGVDTVPYRTLFIFHAGINTTYYVTSAKKIAPLAGHTAWIRHEDCKKYEWIKRIRAVVSTFVKHFKHGTLSLALS